MQIGLNSCKFGSFVEGLVLKIERYVQRLTIGYHAPGGSCSGKILFCFHVFLFSFITRSYLCFKNKLNIPIFVTGILAGLVSITGE